MSRKVIRVCWGLKCSTGLKKHTAYVWKSVSLGVWVEWASVKQQLASSPRERADTLIISWATMCSSTCSNLHSQAPLWRQTDVPRTRCKVFRGGNESEQNRGRRMDIFSRVHNKSLIMNNTIGSLFSQWSELWFTWPLEIVFGFHMGAAVCQKINAGITTCHSWDNYRIKNNAIMYVYLQYWVGILLKQTLRLLQSFNI